MKNKTLLKTLKIITILAIIIFLFTPICLAGGTPTTIDPNEWKPDDLGMQDYDEVVDVAVVIIAVIRYVGVAVSIIVLLIIGIKYMTGTVQEKAEYKKTMIPYIIGALLIFAATTIVNVLYGMFANISTTA